MNRAMRGGVISRSVMVSLLIIVTGSMLGVLSLEGSKVLWILLALLGLTVVVIMAIRHIEAVTVGIFGLLFLGEILLNRDFSHIVLPKPPLYITEVTMVVVLVLLVAQRKFTIPPSIRTPLVLILGVCALSGFISIFKYPAISVMRDSAELYYMMFIPLSYSVFRIARPHLNRMRAEQLGMVMAYFIPLFYLVTKNLQVPSTSEAVAGSIILVAISWDWKYVSSRVVWVSIILNLAALFGGGARGPWIGFLLGLLVLLIASGVLSDPIHRHRVRYRLAMFCVMLMVAAGGLALISPGLLTHIMRDVGSVTSFSGSYSQVANNRWRSIIWAEAFRQFASNPLAIRVGQAWMPIQLIALGYGGVNTTGYALNTVALSNSYLQMLQWYGVWAAIPFWWAMVKVWRIVARNIRLNPVMYSVIALMGLWAVNTGVEVVLEGPYMSAIVWTVVGFGLAYANIGGPSNACGR